MDPESFVRGRRGGGGGVQNLDLFGHILQRREYLKGAYISLSAKCW